MCLSYSSTVFKVPSCVVFHWIFLYIQLHQSVTPMESCFPVKYATSFFSFFFLSQKNVDLSLLPKVQWTFTFPDVQTCKKICLCSDEFIETVIRKYILLYISLCSDQCLAVGKPFVDVVGKWMNEKEKKKKEKEGG